MAVTVIVGAGVIGLTTAKLLLEKGHKVIIISANLPTDNPDSSYASVWAGAHFRPFPSVNSWDDRESGYAQVSIPYFEKLAKSSKVVNIATGIDLLEAPIKGYVNADPTYTNGLTNFTILDKSELPKGTVFGAKYQTWVLNAPEYLLTLYDELVAKGVQIIKKRLSSLAEAKRIVPTASDFFNCTALGLLYNGGFDPACYTIRGQILLLKIDPKCKYQDITVTHQSAKDEWTYVINRPNNGGCVLGGTKQLNDQDPNTRQSDVTRITERARKLYPELFKPDGTLEILKSYVGFRPARKNGSRVELEKVGGINIVHLYGIGGRGYECSYGMSLAGIEQWEKQFTGKSSL